MNDIQERRKRSAYINGWRSAKRSRFHPNVFVKSGYRRNLFEEDFRRFEDSDSDDEDEDTSLSEKLRSWSNEFLIKPKASDALLKTLQKHGHNFRGARSPPVDTPAQPNPASAADSRDEFQRTVLQQLATITNTQRDIMQTLKEHTQMIRTLQEFTETHESTQEALLNAPGPAKSEDELQALEDQLKDGEQQRKMAQYLGAIGGKDLAEVVRRILSAIATYPVWSNYSVHGKRGKKPLKNLTVYVVISQAIMATRPEVTMTEVAAQLQEALKHAPARCKYEALKHAPERCKKMPPSP